MPSGWVPSSASQGSGSVCPYATHTGYVHAVRVRKAHGGGWLVAYDRREGPPGLTLQNCPWTDATRYMVRWYPAKGKCAKFWATATEDEVRRALWLVPRGEDPCGFWTTAKTAPHACAREEKPTKQPSAPANTRVAESEPSRVRAREETLPPTAAIRRPVTPAEEVPFNQLVKELIRQRIPEESVVATIAAGMNATKAVFTDGDVIEVEDHPTRQKFVAMWMEYQVGKAAQEERAKAKKMLDEGHLEQLLLMSQAARDELRALIDEIEDKIAKGELKPAVA